ncbi:MAG: molybdopterin-guanine dinucleotide biosynthesis protein B [Bacillota bacterium]
MGVELVEATAVILAGGRSTRMGTDKAFLEVEGRRLIERDVSALGRVFSEVIIAGDPGVYGGLADRVVKDFFEEAGPLAGVHAGLSFASHDRVFVAACDLPFIDGEMAAFIVQRLQGYDASVPCVGGRLQPLFAAYKKSCLAPVSRYLEKGGRRVVSFLGEVRVRYLTEMDFAGWPHSGRVFFNINTPGEFERLNHDIITSVPVVGVTGFSRTGKTTLLENLVASLASSGYRAAVLKHTWHEVRDTGGKDTDRFIKAGAEKTALTGPGGILYFQREGHPALGKVLSLMEDGVDIILVEGYKEAPFAKIRVMGETGIDGGEEIGSGGRTVAVVGETDDASRRGVPVFSRDDIKGISGFIIGRFLARGDRNC